MECETARLFLHFHRPDAGDLDGPGAEELEHHLAHCSECNALSSAQRRLDQHLGRAMRAVEVPARLRKDILGALAEQRRAWSRRWFGYARRGAAAAAVLLAVSLGWYLWYTFTPRSISPDEVCNTVNFSPHVADRDSANEALKRLGEGAFAPSFVEYAYLTAGPALAELPGYKGVKVPEFVFNAPDTPASAVIYVLDHRRFQIEPMDLPTEGYNKRIEVYPANERGRVSYLVKYTGKNWKDWLKVREPVE
jgi:hypothetical protein